MSIINHLATIDWHDDAMRPLEQFTWSFNSSHTPTTDNKITNQPTFHPFPRLPAELRARIWAIALYNQTKHLGLDYIPHAVEIHGANGKITVRTDRGYPSLFFVNREARYEAAKVDGGAWYAIDSGVEVYASLDKEEVVFFSCYKGPRDSRIPSPGGQFACFRYNYQCWYH
jgi:hypothetical protein